ncbi:MAG TPA: DUF6328 family protein, partial [Pseudonocardiaceae bacterium]
MTSAAFLLATTPARYPGPEVWDGRHRNFHELLQELRVTQTGVQILFAFLLGLSFTPRFATISEFQRDVYVV